MTAEKADLHEQLQNRPPPEETAAKIKSLEEQLKNRPPPEETAANIKSLEEQLQRQETWSSDIKALQARIKELAATIIDLRGSNNESTQGLQDERKEHQDRMNEMHNTLNDLRAQLEESRAREAASSQTIAEFEGEIANLRPGQEKLARMGELVQADGEFELTFTDSKNRTLYRTSMRGQPTQINDNMSTIGCNMNLAWLNSHKSGDISTDGRLELRYTQQQPYRETMRAMIQGKLVDMRQRERLGNPSHRNRLARSVLNTIRGTPPPTGNQLEDYNREMRRLEQRLREIQQYDDREDPRYVVERENIARRMELLGTLVEQAKNTAKTT